MGDFTGSSTINPAVQAVILVVVAIAVLTDVRRRKIYNVLTFPAMALGLTLNTVADGASGLLFAVAGLLLGGALFILPVAAMGRGAGDLKLLAAVGALGGPIFVLWCALFTTIAGGIFAVGVLLARRRLLSVTAGIALDLSVGHVPKATSKISLPYAVPITACAIAALVLRS